MAKPGGKERYYQDESGQWWCEGSKQRFKCIIKICAHCGKEYPTKKVRPTQRCSWTCSNRFNQPTTSAKRSGPLSHLWKGGRHVTEDGYIRVHSPGHPAANNNYVLEHRLVMEQYLGRYLTQEETVHHANGIKDDNRLDNLELWASNHPPGARVADLVIWAKQILSTYGEDESRYLTAA